MSGVTLDFTENDLVDSNNSTSTPLGIGATFTGAFTKCDEYASIQAVVKADQYSAENGAVVEFSVDGTVGGIARTLRATIAPHPDGFFFSVPREAAYFRITYTNGAVAQTAFHFQTMLSTNMVGGGFAPIGGEVTDLTTAMITKSATIGQQPDTDWVSLKATGASYEYSTAKPTSPDAALTVDQILEGPWIDADGWASIEIFITSDQISAVDGIEIQRTVDTGATTVIQSGQSETYSFTAQDAVNGSKLITLRPVLDGFRIVYTNGSIAQTNFELLVTNHVNVVESPGSQLTDIIHATARAKTTRSAIIAPDDSNNFENIGRNGEGTNSLNLHLNGVSKSLALKPFDALEVGQINASAAGAIKVPASTLAYPGKLSLCNLDTTDKVFFGPDNTVTELTGSCLFPETHRVLDLNSTPEVWLITDNTGSDTNILDIEADTLDSNTGVTDPANMYTSNDTRAVFDNVADTCEISGFPGTTDITLANITAVKLKVEMRKEAGAADETIGYSTAYEAEAFNPTSITSGTITASADLTYVVFVSRRDVNADIISITNTMGLSGSTTITTANNGNETVITAIVMTGTATSNGTITVTFDTAADYACLGVIALTNVDSTIPVIDFDTDTTTGGGGGGQDTVSGSVNALANGITLQGIGSEFEVVTSIQAGYTERLDFGSNANDDQLMNVATIANATTAAQAWSASLDSPNDMAGIALAMTPSNALDPIAVFQYEVSGTPGATSLTQTVSAETDATYEVDITSDRAWTKTDIDNTSLVPSISLIGNADLEIDHLWLEVTESGSQARVAYEYEGNN